MYEQLLRESGIDAAYVQRGIAQDELFECFVSEKAGSSIKCQVNDWLRGTCQDLGLTWWDGLATSAAFVDFFNVEPHTDGLITPHVSNLDLSEAQREEEYCFVNLQLMGSGQLQIKCGDHHEPVWASHTIEPGDLYTFDQRIEHGWRSLDNAHCRVFSFCLPLSAMLALPSQYGFR